MPKTIDELRTFVKEVIDDNSFKKEGINNWVIFGGLVGIILTLISLDRKVVFSSLEIISFLTSFFLLIIINLANWVNHQDICDLTRKDRSRVSTFSPDPFIVDNIVKIIILLIVLFIFIVSGNKYIGTWETRVCLGVVSYMIGLEYTAIKYKRDFKQELLQFPFGLLIIPGIVWIFAAIWILPRLTIDMKNDVILCSLLTSLGIGLTYYYFYVSYLSPKTQLIIRLRGCYNRLVSREELDFEEELNRVNKAINGVFIDELLLLDFTELFRERDVAIHNCKEAYDLLDSIDCFSNKSFDKIQKANNLIISTQNLFEKITKGSLCLVEKLNNQLSRLSRTEKDMELALSFMEKMKVFQHNVSNDFDTLKIVLELFRLNEACDYYEKHQECLCKYAPYRRYLGHFVGCIIIPKIDSVFHKIKKSHLM